MAQMPLINAHADVTFFMFSSSEGSCETVHMYRFFESWLFASTISTTVPYSGSISKCYRVVSTQEFGTYHIYPNASNKCPC